jgi:hypothetical protein
VQAVMKNVTCYEGEGWSCLCINSSKEGWVQVNPLRGLAIERLKSIQLQEFMLCPSCMTVLANELRQCVKLEWVIFDCRLGAPQWDMLRFIRALTSGLTGETKLQVKVPCYFPAPFWESVIEAYDLGVLSTCVGQVLQPGPYEIQPHEEGTQELADKLKLWNKLELRNQALSGDFDLTPAMREYVMKEGFGETSQEALFEGIVWVEAHAGRVPPYKGLSVG